MPLLPRIADGDRSAVQECVKRYGPLLWSLSRRHFRNSADAEDAVQEAFVSLWKSAARFDSTRGDEATFVAMIARRRFIDRVRARPKIEAHGDARAVEDMHIPVGPALDERHDARNAEKAMAALPEDKRRVLYLSIHEGMSHAEIASETGLPIGTVKSHHRRGLSAVREALGFGRLVDEETP